MSCNEKEADIKNSRDAIKLLQIVKQLVYSNGSEEIHSIHNQVDATINLFWMSKKSD